MTFSQIQQMLDPNKRVTAGQLFIRAIDKDLSMVAGIIVAPPDILFEHIYVAQVTLHLDKGIDHTEDAKGIGIGSTLTEPWWGVKK